MNLKKWRSLILILVLSLLFINLATPAFAEEGPVLNKGSAKEANAVNAAIVAYRDIIRRYHEAWYPQLLESYKSFSSSPDINEEQFREWYFSNCYYVLYDIDGDGIPELVVQHGDTQANIKPGFTVYTFDAQSMQPVNLGECLTQDKFVSTEFAFSDETERVFVELADYRESTSVKRIHLKNGVLTEEPYYLIPSREAYDIFNKNCLTSYAFIDETGLLLWTVENPTNAGILAKYQTQALYTQPTPFEYADAYKTVTVNSQRFAFYDPYHNNNVKLLVMQVGTCTGIETFNGEEIRVENLPYNAIFIYEIQDGKVVFTGIAKANKITEITADNTILTNPTGGFCICTNESNDYLSYYGLNSETAERKKYTWDFGNGLQINDFEFNVVDVTETSDEVNISVYPEGTLKNVRYPFTKEEWPALIDESVKIIGYGPAFEGKDLSMSQDEFMSLTDIPGSQAPPKNGENFRDYEGLWVAGEDYGTANGGSPWYQHMLSIDFWDDTHLDFVFEWYKMAGTDLPIAVRIDPSTGIANFNIRNYRYEDPEAGVLWSTMEGVRGRIVFADGHVTMLFDDTTAHPMNSYFQELGSIDFYKYSDDPKVITLEKATEYGVASVIVYSEQDDVYVDLPISSIKRYMAQHEGEEVETISQYSVKTGRKEEVPVELIHLAVIDKSYGGVLMYTPYYPT